MIAGISSASARAGGLPQFRDSSLANASASASMRSASFRSRAERSAGVVRDQAGNAVAAAATAASTCAFDASLTVTIVSPVAGFKMSSGCPSPATSSPPISILVCMA